MTEQENKPIEATPTEKEENKKQFRMVPLFSRRSLLILGIGLIAGLALSLVYWIISPTLSSSGTTSSSGASESSGLIGFLGMEPKGPYESKIRVQVVNPGSEYLPLKNLQQMGEYYSAKAESLPFLNFLNDRLAKQMPGYQFSVDDLDQMITVAFDYQSVIPIIKISVVASTEEVAVGLAELVPQDFKEYLAYEENEIRKKQYDSLQNEYDSVKETLVQARQDLISLNPEEDFNTNPEYIALKSKVDKIQELLDTQAETIVSQDISTTDVNTEYNNAVEQLNLVNAKLIEATEELENLSQKQNDVISTQKITLNAKITALQAELDKLMTGTATTIGLAEMIANGDTSSVEYSSTVRKIETISQALAQAQIESQAIQAGNSENVTYSAEYRIARIKVDTLNTELSLLQNKIRDLYEQILYNNEGNNESNSQAVYMNLSVALATAKKELKNLESELGSDRISMENQLAQDKVDNLTSRLDELSQQLNSLVGSTTDSKEADYLVAGNPSSPGPVLPERGRARDTLILGAVAGIIIGWVVMNFRWIIKGMPSNKPSASEKEDQGD